MKFAKKFAENRLFPVLTGWWWARKKNLKTSWPLKTPRIITVK